MQAPEHVIRALQDVGFKEYIEEVYAAAYEQHKLNTLDSPKASKLTYNLNIKQKKEVWREMSEEEASPAIASLTTTNRPYNPNIICLLEHIFSRQ